MLGVIPPPLFGHTGIVTCCLVRPFIMIKFINIIMEVFYFIKFSSIQFELICYIE